MKRFFLLAVLISCLHLVNYGQGVFTIYAINMSDFDIRCEGMPVKGGGIFSKYTPVLKAHKKFAFIIKANSTLTGVEGTLRFRLDDPKYTGSLEVYFDDPFVGSSEFKLTAVDYPFGYQISYPYTEQEKKYGDVDEYDDLMGLPDQIALVRISVDTVKRSVDPKSLPVSGIGTTKPGAVGGTTRPDDALPPVVNFDWQVTQRMPKDDDDDNNGQAYQMVTYYFTTNGDYTAIKPEEGTFSLMVYSKSGQTWTIYDKKKTIIVMDMPKTVAEGGMAGKAVAESITKQPLPKDRDDENESLDVVKTGKTKNILGYTADEYQIKTKKKNAGTASFWYAKVPFDPVRIYTMGKGRPADLSTIQNNPKYKNSIMAIPILNMNYLWVETEAGGKKGQETLEIKHVNNTVFTAGYKIKITHNLKEAMKAEMEMNN